MDYIKRMAKVDKFVVHDCKADKVIEFRRAWWDNRTQDHLWFTQARDRKGNVIASKHITVEYASNILDRYRNDAEVTYRS